MLNLFVAGNPENWQNNVCLWPRDRALTEYISPENKKYYGSFSEEAIKELKTIPCLFMCEKRCGEDARLGYIKDISVHENYVRINRELTSKRIPFNTLMTLGIILDMGKLSWTRTHWTLKTTDIDDLESFIWRPKILVSYSWTPQENKEMVLKLIEKLKRDGVNVVYDDLLLQPGQDMNYFMEHSFLAEDYDHIIVVLNEDYKKKADARQGGVGYETGLILRSIRDDPVQTKYIPVIMQKSEDGSIPLPNCMLNRYCLDLTLPENYEKLKAAIFRG